MAKGSYNDLIFQAGDLARERLWDKPNYPRSMDRVFKAEEALLARRDELSALEEQLNEEDADHQEALAQFADTRVIQERVRAQFKKTVDAIEGKVRALRKKLINDRADLKFNRELLRKGEEKIKDLELAQADPAIIQRQREDTKRERLGVMRRGRELEELERQLAQVLTPFPGQPGSAGIIAHKQLLDLEDLATQKEEEFAARMAELDELIVAKEDEIRAAEEFLDQALFVLGEECYKLRYPDPELKKLYPQLDQAE